MPGAAPAAIAEPPSARPAPFTSMAPAAPLASSATSAAGWPAYAPVAGTVENPLGRRGMDLALILVGGIPTGIGVVLLLSGAIALATAASEEACDVLGCHYNYGAASQASAGRILLITGGSLIGAFVVPFLIGIAGYTYDLAPASLGSIASLRLRVSPSAPGSDVGGAIALEF